MVVKKSQYDNCADANHDQQSCQDESNPEQHSLEWAELESRNRHIATQFQDTSSINRDTVTMITGGGDGQNYLENEEITTMA